MPHKIDNHAVMEKAFITLNLIEEYVYEITKDYSRTRTGYSNEYWDPDPDRYKKLRMRLREECERDFPNPPDEGVTNFLMEKMLGFGYNVLSDSSKLDEI